MRKFVCLAALGLACASGCNLIMPDPQNAQPVTLEDIDPIRNDAELTAQQKRQALEEMDLPALVINALLREERTANQFGGDLRSAWEKISGERFTELTPDEIQLYADAGNELDSTLPFDLTDTAAQAIRDLLNEQGLNTRAELEAFLADPANQIPSDIPDGDLQDIFVNFDSARLIDQLP